MFSFRNILSSLCGGSKTKDSEAPQVTQETESSSSPSLSEATLPPRTPTKMERELAGLTLASFHVEKPKLDDLRELTRLPHGYLLSIWTDLKFSGEGDVSAVFVGREGHVNAPYVLLRSSSLAGFYNMQSVVNKLEDNLDGTHDGYSVSPDGACIVVHLKRESGSGFWNNQDRYLVCRVLDMISNPSLVGAREVELTNLHTTAVEVKKLARLSGIGNAPFSVNLSFWTPSVSVGQAPQAEAA